MTAALEGAIVLARAARDIKPLDVVHRQLRGLLEAELPRRKSRCPVTGSRPPASSASATAASWCRLEGRTLARIRGDKDHPASQGYTCNKALRLDHYQNNRGTADLARCAAGPTAATRRSTGTPRSPRSPTASSASRDDLRRGEDLLLRRRRSGQPPRWRLQRRVPQARSASRYRSNALAQEKTGEALGRRATCTAGTPAASSSTPRSSVFVGKNPWMSQSFPRARTVLNEIAKDPAAVDDRHRPGASPRPRRWPTSTCGCGPGTDAWCLAALAAVLVQEDLVDEAFLAETRQRRRAVRDVLRDGAGRATTRSAAASTRSLLRAAAAPRSPPPTASRRSRTSASSRRPTARCAPTSTSCCGSSPATSPNPAGSICIRAFAPLFALRRRRRSHAGDRSADHRRAGPLQRDRRRRSSPTTRDRFRAMIVESAQPGPLARRLASAAARRSSARAAWW